MGVQVPVQRQTCIRTTALLAYFPAGPRASDRAPGSIGPANQL